MKWTAYRTDFNEQDFYGHVFAEISQVGTDVMLVDDDGNYCVGKVVGVHGEGYLTVKPDWDTWVPSSDPQLRKD